jgi:hypothetical protein
MVCLVHLLQAARQWAIECSLDRKRQLEFQLKKAMWSKYQQLKVGLRGA